MNKTTKWLVGLVVVLVVANIAMAASVWLKKEEGTKPQQGGDARNFLIKELSLTAAQTKSFDSLRKGHFSRMRDYQEKMHELKDALFEQLKWPRNAGADSFAKKIGDLQAIMDLETFEHFSQLRNLLNHQQAQTFDSTIQEVLRTMAPGGPHPPRPGGGAPDNPGGRPGPPPGENPPPDGPPH